MEFLLSLTNYHTVDFPNLEEEEEEENILLLIFKKSNLSIKPSFPLYKLEPKRPKD